MKYILLILISLLVACNSYRDDFFEFLFGTDNLSIVRVCDNNPPFFEEGRYVEIYKISKDELSLILENINGYSLGIEVGKKYSINATQKWLETPISDNDPVLSFLDKQMLDGANPCFSKEELKEKLFESNNYYLPLKDSLGRVRLFILDCENSQLFLISSLIL